MLGRHLSHPLADLQSGLDCASLAEVRGIEEPKDKLSSRVLLDRACRLGDGGACESLALVQLQDDFSGNRAQALDALGVACARGRPASCHRLALLQLGEPGTHGQGMHLLTANCERGHAPSCLQAAIRWAPLLARRPSCRDALPYAERACAAKNEDGCAILEACQTSPTD